MSDASSSKGQLDKPRQGTVGYGRRASDRPQNAGIGAVDGTALKTVVRDMRRAFLLVAVFSFFINLLVLTSPLYMLQLFDRVLTSGRQETLLMLTVIAFVAIGFMGLLEAVRGYSLGRIGRWLYQRLAPGLLQSGLLGRAKDVSDSSQALKDLSAVRGFLTSPSTNVILDAPWVPFFLLIIWMMHPLLGTVALGAGAALLAIAIANDIFSRTLLQESNELSSGASRYAESALLRSEPIRAMGMAGGVIDQWAAQQAPALNLHLHASDRSAALLGLSRFVRLFVQVLILGTGAYLVLNGELTAGGMIAASIMLGRGLAPLEQAVGGWRAMVNARESYHRLRNTMQSLPAEQLRLPLPPPKGHLQCANVGLRLPNSDKAVLR
ncbi:MAG: ABC transporter transmembrane domain-containing protein, partial [Pseudomonadota bacterium]